ncbi:MAG: class I SAM-dependent methyltransferase [Acidobacteria bacterium]|nr:class I SAM-dependent methyltransferase [Acidobacteriota bacterium]
MSLYENTKLYDLVHGPFADSETFEFYYQMAVRYGPKVLDAACGTGHILIPLAEAGIDVCGFDISPEMLAACERKAAEKNVTVDVWLDDLRGFRSEQRFDLIFVAGNSFQHLMTDEDISAAFRPIKTHLNPNGRVLIEMFNPSWPLLMREPEKRLMVGQFGDHILTEDSVYDAANRTSHTTWHFWHRPTGNETSLTYNSREYFYKDVTELFSLNGFVIENHFGEFDLSPYDEEMSSKHLVIASPKANG